MKCYFCGANIDIESDVCPHCGMKKEQFAKHREDMDRYARTFSDTRDNVVSQNKRFSRTAVYITINCILLVLLFIMIMCVSNSYSIYEMVYSAKALRQADTHIARLDEYVESEDFEGFDTYFYEYKLYYVDDKKPYSKYQALGDLCSDYSFCVEEMYCIAGIDAETEYHNYDHAVENFLNHYNFFNSSYQYYLDSKEQTYEEKHIRSIETMRNNLECMIITYLHIPEEEIPRFRETTLVRQMMMIDENSKAEKNEGGADDE